MKEKIIHILNMEEYNEAAWYSCHWELRTCDWLLAWTCDDWMCLAYFHFRFRVLCGCHVEYKRAKRQRRPENKSWNRIIEQKEYCRLSFCLILEKDCFTGLAIIGYWKRHELENPKEWLYIQLNDVEWNMCLLNWNRIDDALNMICKINFSYDHTHQLHRISSDLRS